MMASCLAACNLSYAQLSSNPDKFLGNITTRGQVNGTGFEYSSLWNQITPENESKWSSIEGNRNSFNWGGCDNAYNYAKDNGLLFKFHTLVWGSQYPTWMDGLSKEDQYNEIVDWMDAIKDRYPDLEMIDVVNEAIVGHAPAPYKDALGGDGKTGYDWIIKAFEMAAERWPNAILIYNDYNTFQWQKAQFIEIVKTLRDAGAPIDAYGCQSHDLTDMSFTDFKAAMTEIQRALRIPMYSTEYDIGTSDDDKQKKQYQDQVKYMWEQDYVAGVTLWGYIYGATWTTDGNSGIIKNGKDRPAMTWLREYMASDDAKNAKSPFPGMRKEASVYIKPAALNIIINEPTKLTVNARLATKTIDKVELYAGESLIATMTEEPFVADYTPEELGNLDLKAIVYATDGNVYERYSAVNVANPRKHFCDFPVSLPGTIEAEDFDMGADGIAFHDSNSQREGDAASYRTDSGIDVVKDGGEGLAIGYTNTGEWMEYTVDVKEAGYYDFDLVASAGADGALVSIYLSDDVLTPLASNIAIPNNGWNNYKHLYGRCLAQLNEGKNVIRIAITNTGCNVDKLIMKHIEVNNDIEIALSDDPSVMTVGDDMTLSVNVSADVKEVTYYINSQLYETVTEAPFEATYQPNVDGILSIRAVAADADGKLSVVAERSLKVNKKRSPYKSVITLPGTIEFENFDKGGEGLSFHDSDNKDEGNAKYRSDNEGVDIVACTGGYAVGYTAADEWLEYTVNVSVAGEYNFEAVVSSGADNSGFTLSLVDGEKLTDLTGKISVPNGGNWDTYTKVSGSLKVKLEDGEHLIRVTINGPYCNIDKIKLSANNKDAISDILCSTEATYEVYSLSGVLIGKFDASSIDEIQQKAQALIAKKGIYLIKNTVTGKATKLML